MTLTIDKNCIVNGMPEDVYHSDPTPMLEGFAESTSLSSTTLNDIMEKTEIEARMTIRRLNPNKKDKSSAAADLGSMAHDYILLGGQSLFEIVPYDDFRTKDAQAMRDDITARGKIALNNSTIGIIDNLKTMKARLFEQIAQHKDWKGIFDKGSPEQSAFAFDGEIWNRARFDWLVEDYISPHGETIDNLIVDYKTTALSFDKWDRNVLWDDKYFQDHHYRRVLDIINGKQKNSRFIYVVQQVSEPYLVQIFEIDSGYHDLLKKRYEIGRKKFIKCTKTGEWQGTPPYTAHTTPPPWVEQRWESTIINDENAKQREADEKQVVAANDARNLLDAG